MALPATSKQTLRPLLVRRDSLFVLPALTSEDDVRLAATAKATFDDDRPAPFGPPFSLNAIVPKWCKVERGIIRSLIGLKSITSPVAVSVNFSHFDFDGATPPGGVAAMP